MALEGIVVGDFQNNASLDDGNLNGFHVQDPTGDGNAATSDGVFIYAPGAVDVLVGDGVRVRGTVSEYNGMTEITAEPALGLLERQQRDPDPALPAGGKPGRFRALRGHAGHLPADAVHLRVLQL